MMPRFIRVTEIRTYMGGRQMAFILMEDENELLYMEAIEIGEKAYR